MLQYVDEKTDKLVVAGKGIVLSELIYRNNITRYSATN